jgi:hypothetical protein
MRNTIITALAVICTLIVAAPAAHAKSTTPWLPIEAAAADTLSQQSLFAEWRIREATHVPHETYPDLYSPEEAANWLRELALPSCERVRRNIVDCVAEITVWDDRSDHGETATWTMRSRRYRDARVRDGLVTTGRLRGGSEWSDVTVHKTVVTPGE